MKLVVGRIYRNRGGEPVRIVDDLGPFSTYPFRSEDGEKFTPSGSYYAIIGESELDLIEEVAVESEAKEQVGAFNWDAFKDSILGSTNICQAARDDIGDAINAGLRGVASVTPAAGQIWKQSGSGAYILSSDSGGRLLAVCLRTGSCYSDENFIQMDKRHWRCVGGSLAAYLAGGGEL